VRNLSAAAGYQKRRIGGGTLLFFGGERRLLRFHFDAAQMGIRHSTYCAIACAPSITNMI